MLENQEPESGLTKASFFGLTLQDLKNICKEQKVPAVHAEDLLRASYKKRLSRPWHTPSIPRILKDYLSREMDAELPLSLNEGVRSGYDQSVKFRSRLLDGLEVETVLMPEKKRITLCVSTQVGCAQGCVFCHTGRMGLKRQLSAAEIVAQVVCVQDWIMEHPEWLQDVGLDAQQRVTNIVFMGMGEPLDNVDELIKSVEILREPYGLALGMRHISISTAGHLDGIRTLLARLEGVRLALSVHSTKSSQRAKIMPIEKRWPLAEVIDFLAEELPRRRGSVMLQYTLISQVNDSPEEAKALADMGKRLGAKINVIPLNPIDVNRLKSPTAQSLQSFRDIIHREKVRVMVRYSKGQDIAAACGQLVVKKNPHEAFDVRL